MVLKTTIESLRKLTFGPLTFDYIFAVYKLLLTVGGIGSISPHVQHFTFKEGDPVPESKAH